MSEEPKRIQRKRTKGYRLPPNAVYVGRPTKYGNPYKVDYPFRTAAEAVELHRAWLRDGAWLQENNEEFIEMIRRELKGKDLACWCKLSHPCHADVLLEIANREPDE